MNMDQSSSQTKQHHSGNILVASKVTVIQDIHSALLEKNWKGLKGELRSPRKKKWTQDLVT